MNETAAPARIPDAPVPSPRARAVWTPRDVIILVAVILIGTTIGVDSVISVLEERAMNPRVYDLAGVVIGALVGYMARGGRDADR